MKPFQCEICNKSFNEKGNLKIHIRIHTGEKPYKCSYEGCGKEFKAFGHLSDHLKRHINFKPHRCDNCGACFGRKNTLKTHMLTHSGEKPHPCTFQGCDKRFSEKGNMRTHLKTHIKRQRDIKNSQEIVRCGEDSFIGNKSMGEDREYLPNLLANHVSYKYESDTKAKQFSFCTIRDPLVTVQSCENKKNENGMIIFYLDINKTLLNM
jgi:hypothetical protein